MMIGLMIPESGDDRNTVSTGMSSMKRAARPPLATTRPFGAISATDRSVSVAARAATIESAVLFETRRTAASRIAGSVTIRLIVVRRARFEASNRPATRCTLRWIRPVSVSSADNRISWYATATTAPIDAANSAETTRTSRRVSVNGRTEINCLA